MCVTILYMCGCISWMYGYSNIYLTSGVYTLCTEQIVRIYRYFNWKTGLSQIKRSKAQSEKTRKRNVAIALLLPLLCCVCVTEQHSFTSQLLTSHTKLQRTVSRLSMIAERRTYTLSPNQVKIYSLIHSSNQTANNRIESKCVELVFSLCVSYVDFLAED